MELKHTFLFLLHIKYCLSQCPGHIIPNYDLCYWLTENEANWYEGNSTCFDDGGTPASIPDAVVYRQLVSLLNINSSIDGVWIGINDLRVECEFRNYDGSELTFLDFLFDYKTKGCYNVRDALAIIPADNFTWQEKNEYSDSFIMLCEKDLDKSFGQTSSTTWFYSMVDTSIQTVSISDRSTRFESTMSTEKNNKMEQNPSDKTLIIGLLIGICIGVLLITIIIILICRRRRSKSPKSKVHNQKKVESQQSQKVYSYATMSYENDMNMEEKLEHKKDHNAKTAAPVKFENYSEGDHYSDKPDGVYDITSQNPRVNHTENTYCLKPEGVYDFSNHSQESTASKSRNVDVENKYGCLSSPESYYDSTTQSQKTKINKSLENQVENNYGYTERPDGIYDSANQNQDHTRNNRHAIENDYGCSVKPEGIYDTSIQSPQYNRNELLENEIEGNYGFHGKPEGVYDSAVTHAANDSENVYNH